MEYIAIYRYNDMNNKIQEMVDHYLCPKKYTLVELNVVLNLHQKLVSFQMGLVAINT